MLNLCKIKAFADDNLDVTQIKEIVFLTLYHTISTFNNPEDGAFWKHYGKRRKCW